MYMSSVPNDYKKWYAENLTKWCHFKMTVLFVAFWMCSQVIFKSKKKMKEKERIGNQEKHRFFK